METEACIRCGSDKHFELTRIVHEFEKEGKKFFTYDKKCQKCGRLDPYTSENGKLLDERTALRNDLAQEGAQKQAVAGQVNPNSDQTGAPNPLDKEYEDRQKSGLVAG